MTDEHQNRLLEQLKKLLPAQFEEVMFRFGIPSEYIPSTDAQLQKAIKLIRYAEGRGELDKLEKVIEEYLRKEQKAEGGEKADKLEQNIEEFLHQEHKVEIEMQTNKWTTISFLTNILCKIAIFIYERAISIFNLAATFILNLIVVAKASLKALLWVLLNIFFGLSNIFIVFFISYIQDNNKWIDVIHQFVISSFSLILISLALTASIGVELWLNKKCITEYLL